MLPLDPKLIDISHYILNEAIEGGIDYWCEVEQYKWSDNPFRIEPTVAWELDENGEPDHETAFTLNAETLAKGIIDLFNDTSMPKHLRLMASRIIIDPDNGDVDSDDADCLVQYSFLGEIRYG